MPAPPPSPRCRPGWASRRGAGCRGGGFAADSFFGISRFANMRHHGAHSGARMDPAPTPPAAGPPGTRRRRRPAILPAAALLLPLLILGANAWAGWHAAWRNATTEM